MKDVVYDNFVDYKRMAENFIKVQPIYYDKAKIWWIWDSSLFKWKITDETEILNWLDGYVGRFNTIPLRTKAEILEAFRRIGRLNKPKNIDTQYIQFRNILIDMNNGFESMTNPGYMVLNPIPWDIGKNEETPIIDKLFEDWVGEEYSKTLYQIIAYCMLPDYPIHRIFCLVGKGSNGKSTFLKLLAKFLGSENIVSADFHNLLNSRFGTMKLYKKLACIMGEIDFKLLSKTDILKRLTGQDLMHYEMKNKNPFSDYNYAKILLATNTLPVTTDKTIGFYRRWMIIDFSNTFKREKDILNTIPDYEYENLARKSIRILKELLKDYNFHNEGTFNERENKYEGKSNPISIFLKLSCRNQVNAQILFSDIFNRFNKFALEQNLRKFSKQEFGRILRLEGYDIKTKGIKENDRFTTQKYVLDLEWK